MKIILSKILQKKNPISILTQEFSDIDLSYKLKNVGFTVIGPPNGIVTWRKFVDWFYRTAQNNILIPNAHRVFVINVDLLSRLPKNERTEKQKQKSYSIHNFIEYCNRISNIPVILISENAHDYRLNVAPLKFGKIIDTSNISYVSSKLTECKNNDELKGILYNYDKSFDGLVHYVTDKLLKYNKDISSVIEVLETYFKIHRIVDKNTLINYLSSMFKLDKSVFMTYPKHYGKYFLLGKNEPSILKMI